MQVPPSTLPHRTENLSRALLRDERVYSDPLTFKPERFVASETKAVEIDPRICFGFGRR